MLLLPNNWRPILIISLLLANKVLPDGGSKNIDYSIIFPQFSVQSVNELEWLYVKYIKWELYISTSTYAKYYFTLQSLNGDKKFREQYLTLRIYPQSVTQLAVYFKIFFNRLIVKIWKIC